MEPTMPFGYYPLLLGNVAGFPTPDSNGQGLAEKKGSGMAVPSSSLLDHALGVWSGFCG